MKSITVKDICLYVVSLPYVEPLKTSFGHPMDKSAVLVKLETTDGVIGWGEGVTEVSPSYSYETIITGLHITNEFLIPALVGKTIENATDVPMLLRAVRGNNFSKAGVEGAIWDALAKTNDMRLADYFASFLQDGQQSKNRAEVGVSIGIHRTVEETLGIIRKRLDQGYGRIKLKIQRGWDVELASGVRAAFPDISLMLDANSDYTLADADHLVKLDEFDLLMIEQPLAYFDIYEHGQLQKRLKTRICLDESIKSANDLLLALQVDATRILNLKPARVGGYTECLKIYNICIENNLPLWVGGMLETGIGRAANVAFASLPGITLPSDISATDRYFVTDLAEPSFELGPNSTLAVPDGYGIGVTVQPDRLEEATARWRENYPYKHGWEES